MIFVGMYQPIEENVLESRVGCYLEAITGNAGLPIPFDWRGNDNVRERLHLRQTWNTNEQQQNIEESVCEELRE
jgi:hypothetical protein